MVKSSPRIIVVGSANMDLVGRTSRLPRPGETVIGGSFSVLPGGKGANQAVGAARLGGTVSLIACLGTDLFGDELARSLTESGVDTAHVHRVDRQATGVALISVDETTGENSILVLPGANGCLAPADIESCSDLIGRAQVMVCSLEAPLGAVHAALSLAKQLGLITILNPAPALPLSGELLSLVSILTPNEHEAAVVAGTDSASPAESALRLVSRGCGCVIVTLGAAGAIIATSRTEAPVHIPAAHVQHVVDTTAAGDCFTGALAVAIGEGKSIKEAVRFATAAAAISVTRQGAQASLPTRGEVEALTR